MPVGAQVMQATSIDDMQIVELTEDAKEFPSACFKEFDKDRDGVLSPAEEDDIYSCHRPGKSTVRAPMCGITAVGCRVHHCINAPCLSKVTDTAGVIGA